MTEMYDRIINLVDEIFGEVGDEDKEIFTDILKEIDDTISQFKDNIIKDTDLLAKLEETLADVEAVHTELFGTDDSGDDDQVIFDTVYDELNIDEADRGDVQKLASAHKKWVVKNHPDKCTDPTEKAEAEETFKEFQKLYDIGIDSLK